MEQVQHRKGSEMGKQLLLVNGATGRTVLKDSDSYAKEDGPEGGEMRGREEQPGRLWVKKQYQPSIRTKEKQDKT